MKNYLIRAYWTPSSFDLVIIGELKYIAQNLGFRIEGGHIPGFILDKRTFSVKFGGYRTLLSSSLNFYFKKLEEEWMRVFESFLIQSAEIYIRPC